MPYVYHPFLWSLNPEAAKLHFTVIVEKLYSLNWMSEMSAEDAKVQCDDFLSLEYKIYCNKFSEFD